MQFFIPVFWLPHDSGLQSPEVLYLRQLLACSARAQRDELMKELKCAQWTLITQKCQKETIRTGS